MSDFIKHQQSKAILKILKSNLEIPKLDLYKAQSTLKCLSNIAGSPLWSQKQQIVEDQDFLNLISTLLFTKYENKNVTSDTVKEECVNLILNLIFVAPWRSEDDSASKKDDQNKKDKKDNELDEQEGDESKQPAWRRACSVLISEANGFDKKFKKLLEDKEQLDKLDEELGNERKQKGEGGSGLGENKINTKEIKDKLFNINFMLANKKIYKDIKGIIK